MTNFFKDTTYIHRSSFETDNTNTPKHPHSTAKPHIPQQDFHPKQRSGAHHYD